MILTDLCWAGLLEFASENLYAIKILTKFWRWFHSKRMHQLFLINFLNSVFSYASCSVRIAHCFYNIYHFFYWFFWTDSFFVFSLTPQSCKIQRIRNFLCGKIIFLSKTAITELCKTGDSVNLEKNSKIYQKKNTMELVKRNFCRSKHKYELKLKIKSTKG